MQDAVKHSPKKPRQAIFFDRDGVLNHAIIREGLSYPPESIAEMTLTIDAKSVTTLLKAQGFLLFGATNQPDVARGKTTREKVEAINKKLEDLLGLDAFHTCYHESTVNCQCRKPNPGMILDIAKKYNVDLTTSVMIGDRWKDIDAGRAAGCKTIWLRPHPLYNEKAPRAPDFIANSLTEACEWIQKNIPIKYSGA